MGVGFYLVYPTFYTDTSDAYRLDRQGRLRTDLGGIYFHLIFNLALIALYVISGQEILLASVLLITGDIFYQFLPYLRLDGYWALADLMGIPDPLSQISPFLRSSMPMSASTDGNRLPPLRRWAKIGFIIYISLAVPILALLFGLIVIIFPHAITVAWSALHGVATSPVPAGSARTTSKRA